MFQLSQKQLEIFQSRKHWVVALSGGLDSVALLLLAKEWSEHFPDIKLSAIHINHGLMAEAGQWQSHCADLCKQLSISFDSESVRVEASPNISIEMAARNERYRIFEKRLSPPKTGLLTAHHANDQAETVLFRLFRGSGLEGLSGVPALRPLGKGVIWRPLLGYQKSDLEAYVVRGQLKYFSGEATQLWVDDSSNQDVTYDRNYIRNVILPSISERWPKVVMSIIRSAGLIQQTAAVTQEFAAEVFHQSYDLEGKSYLLPQLSKWSPEARIQILRAWLRHLNLKSPEYAKLTEWSRQIGNYRPDGAMCFKLERGVFRQKHTRLFYLAEQPSN